MWMSSPGWRRQYRFGGSGGSSLDNRFSPIRLSTDVTVDNGIASPPGLVAAWGFDEGSGPTASDSSGNANDGSVNGAVWTSGYFGQALDFDGNSDLVLIPDSDSLDLTTAYTFEAWVRPDAAMSSWKAMG